MRTVILLSATLITESINHQCVNENVDLLYICMPFCIGFDVIDFISKFLKNKYESRRIKNW
jgi:hypothetical protein